MSAPSIPASAASSDPVGEVRSRVLHERYGLPQWYPLFPSSRYHAVLSALRGGEVDRARTAAEKLERDCRGFGPYVPLAWAEIALDARDDGKCERLFRQARARSRFGRFADGYAGAYAASGLARLAERRGDYRTADKWFNRAINEHPGGGSNAAKEQARAASRRTPFDRATVHSALQSALHCVGIAGMEDAVETLLLGAGIYRELGMTTAAVMLTLPVLHAIRMEEASTIFHKRADERARWDQADDDLRLPRFRPPFEEPEELDLWRLQREVESDAADLLVHFYSARWSLLESERVDREIRRTRGGVPADAAVDAVAASEEGGAS
jgi:hypothetical protein